MSSLIYLNAFFCISFYYNNNYQPFMLSVCTVHVVCVQILKGAAKGAFNVSECVCVSFDGTHSICFYQSHFRLANTRN